MTFPQYIIIGHIIYKSEILYILIDLLQKTAQNIFELLSYCLITHTFQIEYVSRRYLFYSIDQDRLY